MGDSRYWIVYDDRHGIMHADYQTVEDLDEFFEYAKYLHSVGFRNVRLLNEVQLGDPVIRVGDD